jgi:hypothetical protein
MTGKTRKSDHECCPCVQSLEHDLRDLKRRLSAQGVDERAITAGRRNKHGTGDWLEELAPQDQAFFRKRLGLK